LDRCQRDVLKTFWSFWRRSDLQGVLVHLRSV
jgi:hypothetical protein